MIPLTWIKDIVVKLTEKYNTNDPFKLAKLMKIQVVFLDLHHEIRGFYKYDRRNKYIFINNNLSETEQRFVCGHEIGHVEMHPRVNALFLRDKTFQSIDRIEIEANTFAVELLLPDEVICEHKEFNLTLNEIANIYGVPKEVAHLKDLRSVR